MAGKGLSGLDWQVKKDLVERALFDGCFICFGLHLSNLPFSSRFIGINGSLGNLLTLLLKKSGLQRILFLEILYPKLKQMKKPNNEWVYRLFAYDISSFSFCRYEISTKRHTYLEKVILT